MSLNILPGENFVLEMTDTAIKFYLKPKDVQVEEVESFILFERSDLTFLTGRARKPTTFRWWVRARLKLMVRLCRTLLRFLDLIA